MNGNAQLLQRKTIQELTRAASRARGQMRSYLEDLEMYSKPEFWEAINETKENKGKRFSSAKELFAELDN